MHRDSRREIARLALPALAVLVAEPIYLLFDLAVVGRLGALTLAGMAIGGLVLGQISTNLTFLSYGTTARASRHFGAGDRIAAVREGVQATWLALGVGTVLVVAAEAVLGPVVSALAGADDIADGARIWLRIAVLGVPLILVAMAGNGWLRGVQDNVRPLRYVVVGLVVSALLCPTLVHGLLGAPHLGLSGSAVANVCGQAVTAGLFSKALVGELVGGGFEHGAGCLPAESLPQAQGPQLSALLPNLRPDPIILRAQLVLARDLIARSLAFQVCFLSAGAVAARFGAASVAAHQLVLQLWSFSSLVLDAVAIAAQSLVGAALGAGEKDRARQVAKQVTRYSVLAAMVLAVVFAAGVSELPQLFTTDGGVLEQVRVPWWFLVGMLPVAGVVFALDGVLLGAGDARYLRTTTLAAGLVGFLPAIWLSYTFGWGLAGIWAGLALFVVLRMVAVTTRLRSGKWSVVRWEGVDG